MYGLWASEQVADRSLERKSIAQFSGRPIITGNNMGRAVSEEPNDPTHDMSLDKT